MLSSEDKLKQIFADVFGVDSNSIDENSSVDTIEKWNSFNHMKLVLALEEQYDVKFQMDQTIEMLRSSGETWAGWLDGLTESFLSERVAMPAGATPSSRGRFEMILSVKEHEMHHRGQLMLVERIVGIVPQLTREMQARMAAAPARS